MTENIPLLPLLDFEMKNRGKILSSFALASVVTGTIILHKKFGGHLSGGRYSTPHSWAEIIEMAPYFISLFIFYLAGAVIYFFIFRREKYAICPACEECISTTNIEKSKCPKCGGEVVILEGYYSKKEI